MTLAIDGKEVAEALGTIEGVYAAFRAIGKTLGADREACLLGYFALRPLSAAELLVKVGVDLDRDKAKGGKSWPLIDEALRSCGASEKSRLQWAIGWFDDVWGNTAHAKGLKAKLAQLEGKVAASSIPFEDTATGQEMAKQMAANPAAFGHPKPFTEEALVTLAKLIKGGKSVDVLQEAMLRRFNQLQNLAEKLAGVQAATQAELAEFDEQRKRIFGGGNIKPPPDLPLPPKPPVRRAGITGGGVVLTILGVAGLGLAGWGISRAFKAGGKGGSRTGGVPPLPAG